MRSFKLAAAGLRHDLAAQGLTPIVPGSRPAAPTVAGRILGRIVATHDQALALIQRWRPAGQRVTVTALRRGYLVARWVG